MQQSSTAIGTGAAVDLDRLADVNNRLARARAAYSETLLAEHETVGYWETPIPPHRDRLKAAAEEYEAALDEFTRFTATVRTAWMDQ
jgi:hypothetical protein